MHQHAQEFFACDCVSKGVTQAYIIGCVFCELEFNLKISYFGAGDGVPLKTLVSSFIL